MAEELALRFVDSSYKECEVPVRDMGGDDIFEKQLSSLKRGHVEWGGSFTPNHSVHIQSMNGDSVEVCVTTVSRSVLGPKRLGVGETWRDSYMFGEWSYGFTSLR